MDFVQRMGISTVTTNNAGVIADIAFLEACVRDDLNKHSLRRMAVIKPLKLVIDNYPDDLVEEMDAINNPEDPARARAKLPFSKVLYIEQDDFREIASAEILSFVSWQRSALALCVFCQMHRCRQERGRRSHRSTCHLRPVSHAAAMRRMDER